MLTSSWFTPLPDGHIRVGISRSVPRRGLRPGFRMYRKLAPGPWFNSVEAATYRRLYQAEVLEQLDPQQVHDDLVRIAGGRMPVLCCFEQPNRPPTWCHRSLAAAWLADALGIAVPEFGYEDLPQALHPLRPPELLV